jgi:branched-subunit amino acid transport protein
MNDYLLVAIVAVGTFAMRASMVTLLAGVTLPQRVEQALGLVAPAVLGGLVAQTLILDGGAIRAPDAWASWYVGVAAAAFVAWRTRSFAWTLVVGMGTVWLLSALP